MIMHANILPIVKGSYRFGADLSKSTWFAVGGPADTLFRPEDEDDLAHFLSSIDPSTNYMVIGVGSNLLVRDGGVRGVVIRLGRGFTGCRLEQNKLYAGSGCLNYNVVQYSAVHNLSGIEFLCGVPGSIGGALAMNAGCYGREVSSVLHSARVLDPSGKLHILSRDDIGYVYRGNTLPEGWIFTESCFILENSSTEKILAEVQKITEQRASTQPIKSKTGGSTFKNPTGQRAWELIDKAGFRGYSNGDAIVSDQHCNFLINRGQATAADIEDLGEEIKTSVKDKFGIELEWEIERIGEK